MQQQQNSADSERSLRFKYFSSVGRIAFILFMGLSIFFISGFVVIKVGISSRHKQQVPKLIGKLYLDVHNLLVENSYRVELDRIHTTNYPFGYIVAQSLSPGSLVKEGSKIVLLVNQSEAIVKVPHLIGLQEDLIRGKLQVYQRDRKYLLKKGAVTYILSDLPEGEVIDQFPAENTPVVPGYPISLLVSDGTNLKKHKKRKTGHALSLDVSGKKKKSKKKRKKRRTVFYIPNLENQNIEIAKSAAYHLHLPALIKVQQVQDIKKNGMVLSQKYQQKVTSVPVADGQYIAELEFTVGRYEDSYQENMPNQFVWIDSSEFGKVNSLITYVKQVEVGSSSELQKLNNEAEGQLSSSVSFLRLGNDPIPLFRQSFDKVVVWAGYNDLQQLDENFEEEQATKDLNKDKKLIFDAKEVEEPTDVQKPNEPTRSFVLDTLEI